MNIVDFKLETGKWNSYVFNGHFSINKYISSSSSVL